MLDEYILNIFTIYYKRIMRVEATLKSQLIIQYCDLYNKNNVYKITYAQFFSKIEKNKHSTDTVYTKLYKSGKTEEEKFKQAVGKMYLSEVTNFLGHPVFLKSKLRKTFFNIETDTKTTEFQSNSKNLNLFRNSIAHIDFKKYSLDKTRFLNALNYFERVLGIDKVLPVESLCAIDSKQKLSVMDILKLIHKIDSKIFDDDKILISIFDEVAMLNGYSYESLPQRWTIIRQKYKLEKECRSQCLDNTSSNSDQLKLDF